MTATSTTASSALFLDEAWHVLHSCVVAEGFVASPISRDNYRRIWARDSTIAGMAAVVHGDAAGVAALKNSIYTLSAHQSPNGQIPSNVLPGATTEVSYGSLAGRVDATTWWIIGASWLIHIQPECRADLEAPILRALHILHVWEFNERGLIYTPLGGNWADEYVCHGYVLYDQLLRLWALRATAKVLNRDDLQKQAVHLAELLTFNYSMREAPTPHHYHSTAYEKAVGKGSFWACSFGPAGYDLRWDMSAHALLLILNLHHDAEQLADMLRNELTSPTTGLIPVFHPTIFPGDPDWTLLRENYRFQFKNEPHQFHNGGCWPVMLGILGLGFALSGQGMYCKELLLQLEQHMKKMDGSTRFAEYIQPHTGEPGGVMPLCFSASGYLLLAADTNRTVQLKNTLLC